MKTSSILFILIALSISVSYPQYLKIGFEEPIQFPTNQFKTGNGINFSFEYNLYHYLAFRTNVGGVSGITKGNSLSPGAYSFFWLEADALMEFEAGIFHPYFGGGAGYNRIDINLGVIGNFVRDTSGYLEADKVKYSLGWNLLTGTNINLSDRIIISSELKYIFFRPDVNSTFKNPQEQSYFVRKAKLNLDALVLLIGVKVSF
jgi:opacity protein-like surface antigen